MNIRVEKIKYGKYGHKFSVIPNIIINDKELNSNDKIILLLFLNCNQNTYNPTISSLASQINTSSREISRSFANLKRLGYISTSGYGKSLTVEIMIPHGIKK